ARRFPDVQEFPVFSSVEGQQIVCRRPITSMDNRISAPTKANPSKGGDAKLRAYVHQGYGRRATEGEVLVGVCSPHPLWMQGFFVPPTRAEGIEGDGETVQSSWSTRMG